MASSQRLCASGFALIRLCYPLPQSYVLYPGMMLANPWVPFAEYNAFICRTGVRTPSLCSHRPFG